MFICSDINPIVPENISNLNYTDNDIQEYTVKEKKENNSSLWFVDFETDPTDTVIHK